MVFMRKCGGGWGLCITTTVLMVIVVVWELELCSGPHSERGKLHRLKHVLIHDYVFLTFLISILFLFCSLSCSMCNFLFKQSRICLSRNPTLQIASSSVTTYLIYKQRFL